MKRLFDFTIALSLFLLFSPLFLVLMLAIVLEDGFPPFFIQKRVGQNEKPFGLYKFRSMYKNSEGKGQLTLGDRDPRVTRVGYVIRKYKLDELPQLINVIKGDMSLVGPRPEVPRYTNMYNLEQKKVLEVKPGITDWASVKYMDETELLRQAEDPEELYINQIMPDKIKINLEYIANRRGVLSDLGVLWATVQKIFVRERSS
ncbi:sugar transferase [Luteibaculum oceani]|uniref:Sugar transferase n=1 Tax=Luteibaculum oceani TaxID=1294296 RepID=A0A5C6UW95_9FLAO|nr:sugar transferase [Luteibaculum oceani]TXC76924.1 sugar transferase [Luteibaculum oceani]